MFISTAEKNSIKARLKFLEANVRALEIALEKTKTAPVEKPKRKGAGWSDASRAAQSLAMKKYWASKKAKAAS